MSNIKHFDLSVQFSNIEQMKKNMWVKALGTKDQYVFMKGYGIMKSTFIATTLLQ